MIRRNKELWWALLANAVVTGFYVTLYRRAGKLPPAYELAGHGLGILGFVLMLMTMTLYSLRKRSNLARWGSTASWLKFHMFTGLVGSYMVLLHPALKLRGVAGVAALLTVVVVVSGLVGRYLYTAVSRSPEVVEAELSEVRLQIERLGLVARPAESPLAPQVSAITVAAIGDEPGRPQLAMLMRRRAVLEAQLSRLARTRRALATWRIFHVPLTVVLMITALVHAGGAIYYATLLR